MLARLAPTLTAALAFAIALPFAPSNADAQWSGRTVRVEHERERRVRRADVWVDGRRQRRFERRERRRLRRERRRHRVTVRDPFAPAVHVGPHAQPGPYFHPPAPQPARVLGPRGVVDRTPGQVIVTVRVPNPRAQRARTAAPRTDAVWIDGYWGWTGAQWQWVDARWEVPPQQNARWIAPVCDGQRWTPGHWIAQPPRGRARRHRRARDDRRARRERRRARNYTPSCRQTLLEMGHSATSLMFCNGVEPYCADALLRNHHSPTSLMFCRDVEPQCAVTLLNRGSSPTQLMHCR